MVAQMCMNHGWTDKIMLQFMQLFRLMTIIIFRVMTYSSISMLPMLLTILLLSLELTCEGIEYHVKPTDPEVTQCPGQPCQALAEYLETAPGTALPMLGLCSCPDITE